VAGSGVFIADNEFQTWIEWLVRNGDLPNECFKPADFYTNALNPFHNAIYASRMN